MFGRDTANNKVKKPLARSSRKTVKPDAPENAKKATKGASRVAVSKKKLSLSLPEINVCFAWLNIRSVIMVLAVSILLSVVYASFVAVETVMDIAVENVKINGQLRYQPEEEVGEIINRYTAQGFVNVDLRDLHAELEALPWIRKVEIERQLPDDLIINLAEEKVAAIWNDDSFINNYGDVFNPENTVQIPGLVKFSGKNHKEVLALYKRVQGLLTGKQQPVVSLALNERGVVTIGLQGDSRIVLNADELDQQLMRWNKIVDRAISQQLNEIKQADLRYNNGAAVSWKTRMASNKKALGGR